MKTKFTSIAVLTIMAIVFCTAKKADAQLLNSVVFKFPNGLSEWSEPLQKDLQSKKMAKDNVKPVSLTFSVKFQKHVAKGKWYFVKITNNSADTKIKFDISAGPGQDVYSIKLKPGETITLEKFNWHVLSFTEKTKPDDQTESWSFMFENISAD